MEFIEETNIINVLLVSDNIIDSKKIEHQLMNIVTLECKLHHSTTLAAALSHLGKYEMRVDVVILDIRFDNGTCTEDVYKQIDAATESSCILILTGDEEEEIASSAAYIAAGAVGQTSRNQLSGLTSLIRSVLFPTSVTSNA